MDIKKSFVITPRKAKNFESCDNNNGLKNLEESNSLFKYVLKTDKQEFDSNILLTPPPVTPRKLLETGFDSSNLFYVKSLKSSKNDPFYNTQNNPTDVILRGIFNLDGKSVDVELSDDYIIWKSVNGEYIPRLNKKSTFSMSLNTFYSIEMNIIKRGSKKQSIESIDGFILNYFENQKPNIFKPKSLIFQHPHLETTKEWIENIKKRLPTLQQEKEVLVLLNPYSGEKRTRSIFNFQIGPYLEKAQIKYLIIEFHDNVSLRDSLLFNKINFNNYYGILILAGDGGVSKCINIIIELISRLEKNFNLNEISDLKNKLKSPFCIIPAGSTNMIANSIYGTTNFSTPLMHLIYGNSIRIDISTVFTKVNKIHNFGFGYSAGFGMTLARYLKRYYRLGNTKVQTSLARALAKNKHKEIEVEIHYIKNNEDQTLDENFCTEGCKICSIKKNNLNSFKLIDKVEEFDPIENSIHEIRQNLSSTFKNKQKNFTEWEIIRGNFIHIALLTNSTQWDDAPGGSLSKFGHLGDGYIDLILIDQVTRKDLYRFAKRHTNHKNQLDLPFVKSVRIKEAKIKILNSNSDNLIDNELFNYKESFHMDTSDDDDLNKTFNSASLKKSENRVGSFRLNPKSSNSMSASVYFIKNITNQESENGFENSKHNSGSSTAFKKSNSIMNLFKTDKIKTAKIENLENSYSGSIPKGASLKNISMWNCDWNIHNLPEFHIKCNKQFLPVFATGLDRNTEFENSNTNCLPSF